MDHLTRGIYFTGQRIAPTRPSPNIPSELNDDALMALPFIGLRVGIDEMTPTKAVYAIYDGEVDSLRFVHGDGSTVMPDQICFLKTFKNGPTNNAQRLHLRELKTRSNVHFQQINSKAPADVDYAAEFRNKFSTKSSVTASLTFISDLRPDSCPALTPLPPAYLSQFDGSEKKSVLYTSLVQNPKHNFSTRGFQARISRDQRDLFQQLHIDFTHAYKSKVSFLDFQHAAYCLKTLKEAGKPDLIQFMHESRNDPKYFVDGLTPPLSPTKCVPLETTTGWTVDCFLACFEIYQELFEGGVYQQLPNPVLWLEARLEEEKRNMERGEGRVMRPWKGEINGKKCRAVIDWDILAGLDFTADFKYPRLFSSQGPQPVKLEDIINPKTGNFRKLERAKQKQEKRREETKARAAEVEVMDLTGDDDFDSLLVGHMNKPYTQLPVRTTPRRRAETATDKSDTSSGFTPINKRKHDDGQNHGWTTRPGIFGPRLPSQRSDSNADLTEEYDGGSEAMDPIKRIAKDFQAKIHEQSKGIKKEKHQLPFDGPDDIYSSDREPSDLFATPTKRLCLRNGSPVSKPLSARVEDHSKANLAPLQADPFLNQDTKMEDEESLFVEPSTHHHENQDYFATPHEADSESDNEIMNTASSTPKTPTPRSNTPKQRPTHQRFLDMFAANPTNPKPCTPVISTPRTPTSGPKAASKFLEMFNKSTTPLSPEAKKFNEACDAFEAMHKSPPNTPVSKHKFQPVPIKEEEEPSMRVQPPFGVESEIETDGFVDFGDAPLAVEHPGGAEVKMEELGEGGGNGSCLGNFLGR